MDRNLQKSSTKCMKTLLEFFHVLFSDVRQHKENTDVLANLFAVDVDSQLNALQKELEVQSLIKNNIHRK